MGGNPLNVELPFGCLSQFYFYDDHEKLCSIEIESEALNKKTGLYAATHIFGYGSIVSKDNAKIRVWIRTIDHPFATWEYVSMAHDDIVEEYKQIYSSHLSRMDKFTQFDGCCQLGHPSKYKEAYGPCLECGNNIFYADTGFCAISDCNNKINPDAFNHADLMGQMIT